MQPLAIAILAAGNSKRLGRPKQLLPWHGKPLLEHTTNIALATQQNSVLVVLGSDCELIRNSVTGDGVTFVHNNDWREGMASSIRAAVAEVQGVAAGIMILNCDQPLLTADSLKEMIALFHPRDHPLIAAQYNGVTGSPVIFSHIFFSRLLQLRGDVGAKALLQEHSQHLIRVDLQNASLDIDTEEDWRTITEANT